MKKKTPKPKEATPTILMAERRMLDSRNLDGFPIGKQGLHTLTWIRPACCGVFFLTGAVPIEAEKAPNQPPAPPKTRAPSTQRTNFSQRRSFKSPKNAH